MSEIEKTIFERIAEDRARREADALDEQKREARTRVLNRVFAFVLIVFYARLMSGATFDDYAHKSSAWWFWAVFGVIVYAVVTELVRDDEDEGGSGGTSSSDRGEGGSWLEDAGEGE